MSEKYSKAKNEASRRNSRRSTGPKDATSTRFNAVKHGLLAEGVTELDNPETFSAFCAKLESELKPFGEIESFLVRQIALGMVRLKRAAKRTPIDLSSVTRRGVDACLFALLREIDGAAQEHAESAPAWQP